MEDYNADPKRKVIEHAMNMYDSLINIEYFWNGLDDTYSDFILNTDFPFEKSIEDFRESLGKWILTMRYGYDS